MKRTNVAALLIGAAIALLAGGAAGEDSNPREMIHAYRVWKLTEVLDLSEETMPVFFSRLKELDKKEAELVRHEQKAIMEIAELLRKDDVREDDLRRALDKHEAARMKITEDVRRLRSEALAMLDVRQRCEYVVFEHRFRANLREIIERARDLREGRFEGPGRIDDFGWPDPGGRGVGGGTRGGSGRGRR